MTTYSVDTMVTDALYLLPNDSTEALRWTEHHPDDFRTLCKAFRITLCNVGEDVFTLYASDHNVVNAKGQPIYFKVSEGTYYSTCTAIACILTDYFQDPKRHTELLRERVAIPCTQRFSKLKKWVDRIIKHLP